MARIPCLTALFGGALLCAAALADEQAKAPPAPLAVKRVALRSPEGKQVEVHGAINYDKAGGGTSQMLYPAVGGLAGLLVGIATHAAISSGVQDAEKQKMRDQADAILLPHKDLLAAYGPLELSQAALPQLTAVQDKRLLVGAAAADADEVALESIPVFYLTQDRRALILENVIAIRVGSNPKPHVVTTIRVVSAARASGDGETWWFDAQGQQLRAHGARMFAQSLDIALADVQAAPGVAAPFKTVRFTEGGAERMERAQILSEKCGQIVLRTLRGNLMSVPRAGAVPEADCTATAQG